MGLLDSMVGLVAGQAGAGGAGVAGGQGGGNAALVDVIASVLGSSGSSGAGGAGGAGAGLNDLISRFEQGGLGHVIGSWISTGQNLPISAEQLQSVLGTGTLGQIAQQLGISHGEAASQLSQLLPQIVDHLTPNGQLPAAGGPGGIGDIGSLLGKLLSR